MEYSFLSFFVEYSIIDKDEKLLCESWKYFNSSISTELILKQLVIIIDDFYLPSNNDKKYIYYRKLNGVCSVVDKESIKIDDNKLMQYFESFKKNIFEQTKSIVDAVEKEKQDKIERAKFVRWLTHEYFENLLSNDNVKMFVIDLCTLFDAILHFDYKCDAKDFYGRMNQFFDKWPKSRYYEDVWLETDVIDLEYENKYVQPWNDNRDLINKLRIKRNSIVHPENDERANLNKKELKQCLDFVFTANGENIFNG